MSLSRPVPPPTAELAASEALPDGMSARVRLSIVIPMYEEEDNVRPLYDGLRATLESLELTAEIVIVDDGSRDGTFARLQEVAAADPRVKLIRLRRNFGQTAALAAGFDHAQGEIVVSMDGDLQNDPADIPLLLAEIDNGYDVVCGWRKHRQDPAMRRVPSTLANKLIGLVTGIRLHDYGCTLKAFRADIVEDMQLYGEMHRFLPALAHQAGASITEIPVQHHARRFGKSKYGLRRTLKVILDLMTVKFLSGYATKPSYVFGGSGALLCLAGVAAAAYTAYEKWVRGIYAYRNPLLLVAVFLFIIGFNMILMGLLAELIVRTHQDSQSTPIYAVRELYNLDETDRS
jgi:glycosyltransferase involved in cell wall biosynthesis